MRQKDVFIKDSALQEKRLAWWHYLLPATLLSLLTTIFYYPSLNYQFQFDDIANITKHFDIRHNTFSALFFTGTRWISYWINAVHYSISGFNPFSYRVGNLIIHTCNGLLIFFILLAVLRHLKKQSFFRVNAYPLALLTAVLFLLHPVHTQTVSYVIQGQLEGLSTFFILGMVFSFVQSLYSSNPVTQKIWVFFLFLAAALSCGTKEIAIISPALLLLVDWFFIAQGNWNLLKKRIWLHASVALFIVSIYLWFLKPQFFTEILGLQKVVKNNIGNVITQNPGDAITPWAFLISQFKVVLHYLWIFIWPFNISVEYDWVLSRSFFALDSFVPFLVLVAIGFGIARLLRANVIHPIAFGALWFFICIAPRSSIIPSPELLVDYKTYMASIGWLFILACGILVAINALAKNIKAMQSVFADQGYGKVALSFMVALPLGFSTMQRNTVWRSGIDFWGNMIKNAPGKARAYNNYGVEVSQQLRKFDEAIPYFQKAISMDKNYPDPWNNLAVAYANLNQLDKAITALKEGIKINPYYPEGYNNIASFYLQKKELALAEQSLEMAIKLRPYYGKAHFNLGRVHLERGNIDRACECFKNACTKADFDTDHGFAAWGQISINMKKYDDAVFAYEKALRLNPDYPGAAFGLANAYFYQEKFEQAILVYKNLLAKNPQAHQVTFNIGETYFVMKNYQEALRYFGMLAAPDIKKQLPQVYIRTAQCLTSLGKIHEAKQLLAELNAEKAADPMLAQVQQAGRQLLAQLNSAVNMPTIIS